MSEQTDGPAKTAILRTGAVAMKIVTKSFTLITEAIIVAALGGYVGMYLNAKTIVSDCQSVNLAKIGETYVSCKLVEPVKDAVTAAPR